MTTALTAQLFNGHAPQLTLKDHHVKSQGAHTRRIEFCLFNNSPQNSSDPHYKVACLAIKELSAENAVRTPSKVKLGFFEKFFWKPVSIQTATGEHKTILVNINSAIKRLGVLGFSSSQVQQALQTNSLSNLLISQKAQKIKDSAEQCGCPVDSSLMQELKNTLIHIQQIKLQLNGDQSFKFSSNIKVEFTAFTQKIKLTISDKHTFDFDSGSILPTTTNKNPENIDDALTLLINEKSKKINAALDLPMDEDSLKEVLLKIEETKESWKNDTSELLSSDLHGVMFYRRPNQHNITLNIRGQLVDYDTGSFTSYMASGVSKKLSDTQIKLILKHINDNYPNVFSTKAQSKFINIHNKNDTSSSKPWFTIISLRGFIFVWLDGDTQAINLITGLSSDIFTADITNNNSEEVHSILANYKKSTKKNSKDLVFKGFYSKQNNRKYLIAFFKSTKSKKITSS